MSEVRSYRLQGDPFPPDPRLRQLSRAEARALLRRLSREPGSNVPESVALPRRIFWRTRRVSGARFKDVALNGIYISLWPFRTRLTDCNFEQVDFDGPYFRKVDFTRCRFAQSHLGKRTLSFLDGCSFTDCSFEEFGFGHGQAFRSVFDRCSLRQSRASGFKFRAGRFHRCTWTGSLKNTGFTDCSFDECDFSALRFTDCMIIGGSRQGLRLPDRAEGLEFLT